MEDSSVLTRPARSINRNAKRDFIRTDLAQKEIKTNPVVDKLIEEGGENFIDYISSHGKIADSNLVILPSGKHYYYENDELEGVTTLVNLKKLNLIKHLDGFLNTINNSLSPKAKFIGCFSDRRSQRGTSLLVKIYKRFINFLDARIDITIDRNNVSKLFESRGFRIIDMTEINGLTYFITQNNRKAAV